MLKVSILYFYANKASFAYSDVVRMSEYSLLLHYESFAFHVLSLSFSYSVCLSVSLNFPTSNYHYMQIYYSRVFLEQNCFKFEDNFRLKLTNYIC